MYEKNGGSIFCDSLELGNKNKSNAAFWTPELLEEFKERRGYDLTPYLPTLFIDNYYSYYAHGQDTDAQPNFEFGDEGYQIREDFYKTLTELFTENHVEKNQGLGPWTQYDSALSGVRGFHGADTTHSGCGYCGDRVLGAYRYNGYVPHAERSRTSKWKRTLLHRIGSSHFPGLGTDLDGVPERGERKR